MGGGQPYPPIDMEPMDPDLARAPRQGPLQHRFRTSSCAAPTRTPPSQKLYEDFLGEPNGDEGPRAAPHPLPRPHAQGDPVSDCCHASTDNWADVKAAAAPCCPRTSSQFIDDHRQREHSESHAHRHPPQGPGPLRLPGPGADERRGPARADPPGQGHGGRHLLPLFPAPAPRQAPHQRLPRHGLLREGRRKGGPEAPGRAGHPLRRDHARTACSAWRAPAASAPAAWRP